MCRYANAQPLVTCPSQFADVASTTLPTYCASREIQLNGSAIPLFNSTTYYDKMMWAAAWMYKVRCWRLQRCSEAQTFLSCHGTCTLACWC